MRVLTKKSDFLALAPEPVKVTLGMGVQVYVRPPKVSEAEEYEKLLSAEGAAPFAVMEAVLLNHIVDENGHRVFSDEDESELRGCLPAADLMELFQITVNPNIRRLGKRHAAEKRL